MCVPRGEPFANAWRFPHLVVSGFSRARSVRCLGVHALKTALGEVLADSAEKAAPNREGQPP